MVLREIIHEENIVFDIRQESVVSEILANSYKNSNWICSNSNSNVFGFSIES